MVPSHSHANHSRGSYRPPSCRCRAPMGPDQTGRPAAQPPEPPITFTLPHWPRSSHHARPRKRTCQIGQARGQASTAPHACAPHRASTAAPFTAPLSCNSTPGAPPRCELTDADASSCIAPPRAPSPAQRTAPLTLLARSRTARPLGSSRRPQRPHSPTAPSPCTGREVPRRHLP
jgi:hypothetical protein